MHHRKYEDTTLFHGIEDAVWEAPYKATTNTRLKLWPGIGKVNDVLNGVVYLNGEVLAETLLAAFVVLDGLLELDLGLRVEGVIHPAKRFRICAKTWSPGIAFTRPVRTSSRRRSALAIHCRSMSSSGELRLRSMESTTIALSSTGREITSAINSFGFMVDLLFCVRITG